MAKKLPTRKTTRITARDRLAYRIRVEHAAVRHDLRESLLHARRAGALTGAVAILLTEAFLAGYAPA